MFRGSFQRSEKFPSLIREKKRKIIDSGRYYGKITPHSDEKVIIKLWHLVKQDNAFAHSSSRTMEEFHHKAHRLAAQLARFEYHQSGLE